MGSATGLVVRFEPTGSSSRMPDSARTPARRRSTGGLGASQRKRVARASSTTRAAARAGEAAQQGGVGGAPAQAGRAAVARGGPAGARARGVGLIEARATRLR